MMPKCDSRWCNVCISDFLSYFYVSLVVTAANLEITKKKMFTKEGFLCKSVWYAIEFDNVQNVATVYK